LVEGILEQAQSVDISASISTLGNWELAGYAALAIVIIGVVGESVHEFTSWFGSTWRAKGGKAAALVLVAGRAGEGIAEVEVNNIGGEIIAFQNKQDAQLQLDLEKERTKTAPRHLTKWQFDALQELKGVVSDVGLVAEWNLEARSFAARSS
jgi:hypothetical protein